MVELCFTSTETVGLLATVIAEFEAEKSVLYRNQFPVFVFHLTSVGLFQIFLKIFVFENLFLDLTTLRYTCVRVCVCVCACVRACVRACLLVCLLACLLACVRA